MIDVNLVKIIGEEIRKDREEKLVRTWHCSKIGQCLRGTYLERAGADADTEFDDRTLRVFSVGNFFEDWLIQAVSNRKEFKVETQVRVEDKSLDVSGRIDLLVETAQGKKVYEVKSKHSRAFWHMTKEGKPMRHHEYQIWTYLKILGIPEGAIVYLSKDDLAIQEYPVFLNNPEVEKEVLGWLFPLQEAWKKKRPDLLPLPEAKSWQEKYCRYHNKCVTM